MKIKKRTDMICLRFVDVGNLHCIREHKDILASNGYVWFGKIGVKPSINRIEGMIKDGSGLVVLKKPDAAYICNFDKYSLEKPKDEVYPKYYKDKDLLGYRDFTMWFRLLSIKKIEDESVLNSLIVKSSAEQLSIVAKKSMSSLFYIVKTPRGRTFQHHNG